MLSLVETQLNLDLTTKTFSLRNKLFQNRTATVSIASHNTYELLGKRQQGRVLTGVMGSLTNAVVATGSDSTGLGRWNWIELKGGSCSTFIITAYQSVKSRSSVNTVCMQRKRYFKKHGETRCSRALFIDHLVAFIRELRESGHEVILAADVNEHSVNGKLSKALQQLGVMESYFRKFSVCGPASHIRGKEPIDGIWSSGGVAPTAVMVFPHSFGVGDHRAIVLDFRKEDLQGQQVSICRPSMRRLIGNYPSIVEKYNKEALRLMHYHQVP